MSIGYAQLNQLTNNPLNSIIAMLQANHGKPVNKRRVLPLIRSNVQSGKYRKEGTRQIQKFPNQKSVPHFVGK
jgi:hypothetical protein